MTSNHHSYLKELESESIYIIREVVAECKNPVMLYSAGKDSSVLLHLAKKAMYPGTFSFPLLHIDTGYKYPEMYEFRDRVTASIGARLIVERNEEWIGQGAHPKRLGNDRCCQFLKTQGLLQAMIKHSFDAAIGGARREEEKSRAKERIFSHRDTRGQWDPKNQRPEVWDIYNSKVNDGETIRVFPLSNWTELDIWQYIRQEQIEVVPLYFAKERPVIIRNNILIPLYSYTVVDPDNTVPTTETVTLSCRFRSLGCIPCTGAIRSDATTLDAIIDEVAHAKKSERENRLIDLTGDSSMEDKKREGYF